jgi:DNA-binding CsgD family transcriptional regulator
MTFARSEAATRAWRIGLEGRTVKHHVSNIFDKLGVSNRAELAVYATTRGLAQQPTSPTRTSR